MKKILTFALMAMIAMSAAGAKKKEPAKNQNKPVFTTIKANPITTIKDQNRSGVLFRWFAIMVTVSLLRVVVPRTCFTP